MIPSMKHPPTVLPPVFPAALRRSRRFDYNSDFCGCLPASRTCFAVRGCLSPQHELVNAS